MVINSQVMDDKKYTEQHKEQMPQLFLVAAYSAPFVIIGINLLGLLRYWNFIPGWTLAGIYLIFLAGVYFKLRKTSGRKYSRKILLWMVFIIVVTLLSFFMRYLPAHLYID